MYQSSVFMPSQQYTAAPAADQMMRVSYTARSGYSTGHTQYYSSAYAPKQDYYGSTHSKGHHYTTSGYDISRIIEPRDGEGGLFLGNYKAASDQRTLSQHGIQAILTVCESPVYHPPHLVPMNKQVHAVDHEYFDLKGNFGTCIDFIEQARMKGLNVLVHCMAGVSRSSSVVIAYLMNKYNLSMDEELSHTTARRPFIRPNDGFFSQLKEYERDLRSGGGGFFQVLFDWF
jgi:hypothetical protein